MHDIEREILFQSNNKLVAHDSEGFEAGQSSEVNVVADFIERRGAMEDVNERLYMVWYGFRLYWLLPYSSMEFGIANSALLRYCMGMNSRQIQHAEREFFSSSKRGLTLNLLFLP